MNTDEQAVWHKDMLDRKKEGLFLSEYLLKRYVTYPHNSFVLNINAEWGFGKTYFLKNLSQELASRNHPVIYFDAWQNDYSEHPLLAFISQINISLKPFFGKSKKAIRLFSKTWDASKKILVPVIIKKLTGFTYDQLIKEINPTINDAFDMNMAETSEAASTVNEVESLLTKAAELALENHETVRDSIILFKKNMSNLLKHIDKNIVSRKLPMFIFIDELDRCRPNYAIELLENIKHIFDIPGIMFIIATDSKQLSHSINAIYGEKFASERYLKRFFDQEYNLIKPNSYAFSNYLFELNGIHTIDKFFSPLEENVYPDKNLNVQLFALYSDWFKLSLRDQEQVVNILIAIVFTWKGDCSIHLGYLLFLIILKQHSNNIFHAFIEKNTTLLQDNFKAHLDLSIHFESYHIRKEQSYISRTSTKTSFEMITIIDEYRFFLDQNINKEKLYERPGIVSNTFQKKISQQFLLDDQKCNRSFENLHLYPNLVLQAGQLS